MRRSVILCFILISLPTARAGLSPLEAISMIESGDDDLAIGRFGEVSRFQIMPRVWRAYTSSWNYRNPSEAAWVAEKHLGVLEAGFRKKTGREPSDFDRYVLWNAGLTYYNRIGFVPQRVHRIIRERALRYVNLREMKREPNRQMASIP